MKTLRTLIVGAALCGSWTAAALAQPAMRGAQDPNRPGLRARQIRLQRQAGQVGQPGQAGPRRRGIGGPVRRPQGPGGVRAPAPQAPFPPLSERSRKYVHDLLSYWEYKSRDIRHYQCRFRRWRYDPVFGPRDPREPAEYSEGVIKFEEPDKGLFKVEKTLLYRGPDEKGEAQYARSPVPGEHWVSDGKYLYEFDWKKKRLIKRALPPHIRGTHIANGPVPFLFRATARQINKRFWVRGLRPQTTGEYRVEAYPKQAEDAASFKKVEIVLSREYLPKAVVLYSPNFRPDNPARTTYEFEQRKPNAFRLNLPLFQQDFIVTRPPASDWQVLEVPFGGQPGGRADGSGPPRASDRGRFPPR